MPVVNSTSRIKLLDPVTIDQIAAGEVVERPASALKEILENALDAGATQITVRLAESGRSLIEVEDNGCGMSGEEIAFAIRRHATSKIAELDDLNRISTLGFRGEALPSIASVSKLSIHSSAADGTGHLLKVNGGAVGAVEPKPRASGTTITVEDLFYNTPARSKFLKADSTELSQCIEVASKAALSHPGTAIEVWHNGTRLLRTSGSGDYGHALGDIWGWDLARSLQTVSIETGAGRMAGAISPPHITKSVRSHQWMFVNGRPVKSRLLTAALDQAYRSITPERRFPLTALIIDVDPGDVDINVSPTKTEVKFRAEGAVFDLVRRGIKQCLLENGMMPSAADITRVNEALAGSSNPSVAGYAAGFAAAFGRHSLSPAIADPTLPLGSNRTHGGFEYGGAGSSGGLGLGGVEPGESSKGAEGSEEAPYSQRGLLDGLTIMGQVDATYIVAETKSAILIIDQHVAHERILFEQLKLSRDAKPADTQQLLEPQAINLDRRSLEAIRPHLAEFKLLGFEIEEFGDEGLLLRATPAMLTPAKASKMLADIIDDIAESGALRGSVSPRDEILIMCSCKMAIKAGDSLAHAEMQKLVEDLATTENPYLCPHGRPITLVIPKSDVAKKFKRS